MKKIVALPDTLLLLQ